MNIKIRHTSFCAICTYMVESDQSSCCENATAIQGCLVEAPLDTDILEKLCALFNGSICDDDYF